VGLAAILAALGQDARSAAEYRAVLAASPGSLVAAVGLAELLATSSDASVRDGGSALALASRALRASDPPSARALAAVAAAHAEMGRFDSAVSFQERALAAAPSERAAEQAARLALYRAGSPYRKAPAAGE
jgi:tetratricopeptide (TPR) repeat protein